MRGQERDSLTISLHVNPLFDSVHSGPRFAEMVKRMGW